MSFRDDLLEKGIKGGYYVSRKDEGHMYCVRDISSPGIFDKKILMVDSYRWNKGKFKGFKQERLNLLGCLFDRGAIPREIKEFESEYKEYERHMLKDLK